MSARSALSCKLGDRHYLVDTEELGWATVRPTRQGIDQGAGAGEASLSNEVVWRRRRDNWVGGAGQEYADLTDDDDPSQTIRFWRSEGIDCWTRRQFTISPPLRYVGGATGGTIPFVIHPAAIDEDGGAAWLVDRQFGAVRLVRIDPQVGSIEELGGPGGVGLIGATSFGDASIFTLEQTSGRVNEVTWTGTDFDVNVRVDSSELEMIAACGSRLIGASGATLYEITTDGPQEIFTHHLPLFRWRGGLAMSNGLYVWGDHDGRGELLLVPLADATGALQAPISAARMPIGEMVTTAADVVGTMAVGTNRGVRLLTPNGDGTLTIGPAVDEVGAVSSLVNMGRFLYAVTDEAPGLWRLDPGRFVDLLLPAFAAESVWDETYDATVTPQSVGVIVAGEYPTLLVSGVGPGEHGTHTHLYLQPQGPEGQPTVARDGWLDLGWATFGIGETLSIDSVSVECDPTPAGSVHQVRVLVDTAEEEAALEGVAAFGGGDQMLEVWVDRDVRTRRFKVRVELTGDTAAGTAPVVREVVLRAAPAPHLSDEMVLPLVLSDAVADERGQHSGLDPWEEFSHLMELRNTRQRVPLELGAYRATVRVEDVGVRPGGLGAGNGLDGWSSDGQWIKGRWDVRLVTVEG